MKRHIQKPGVRKYFGQDMIDLQAEPLKALDAFFAEYGACIITGCEVTAGANDTHNVAAGLVAITATDPETSIQAITVMPFAGAEGVALPLFLTAQMTAVERVYGDGRVKPVAYDFHAVASGIEPETPYITVTAAGGNRFVDVVQDDKHSFITAAERSKWNAVLQTAKEYADAKKAEAIAAAVADASTKSAAALRSANTYTDGKDTVLRSDMAIADTATIRAAKDYADQVVAALVDNSPEALNTLQELAKALGDDPNFSTTVMTEIGKRMKTTDVTAALAGKANREIIQGDYKYYQGLDAAGIFLEVMKISTGTTTAQFRVNKDGCLMFFNGADREVYHSGNFDPGAKANKAETICWKDEGAHLNPDNLKETGYYFVYTPGAGTILVIAAFPGGGHPMQIFVPYNYSGIRTRSFNTDAQIWSPWVEMYHSGNLGAATQQGAGLMSAADKTKLDTLQSAPLAAYKIAGNGYIIMASGPKALTTPAYKNGSGDYLVYHNIGNTNYYTMVISQGYRGHVGQAILVEENANSVRIGTTDMNGEFWDLPFQVVLMPKN